MVVQINNPVKIGGVYFQNGLIEVVKTWEVEMLLAQRKITLLLNHLESEQVSTITIKKKRIRRK